MALKGRNLLTDSSGSNSGGYGSGGNSGGSNMTIGDYANGMPSIRLSEIPKSFLRQLPWMLIALIFLIGASWWFTKDIKRQYLADGRLFVKIGSSYVYDSATGSNQTGITITPDMVVSTEVAIIKNSALIDEVIHKMIDDPEVGGERFAPKLYKKYVKAGERDKNDRWNDIVKMVEKSYTVLQKPKAYIVDLAYKHEDGEVAVKTLDAFMSAYLIFRKEKFVSEVSDDVSERRRATEEQLKTIEDKIQHILNKNNISEFGAEQKGVQKRAETLRTDLNKLRGQLMAAETALATTEDQLRAQPQTIDLYIDDRASQRLAQAELEKRQLLAKYLPNSNPVKAKQAEIRELRAQINAYGGKPNGGRRVGPNPTHQKLMDQRNTYQAQADSYREQETVLVAQVNQAVGKVKRMRKLGPVYNNLMRQRTSLETQVINLTAKEQENIVSQLQQDSGGSNITEIARPSIPRKDRNMKKIMFSLATLASLFTVFMLALLRVFLDPKLYGADHRQHMVPVGAAVVPSYDDYKMPAEAPEMEPEPYRREDPIPDSVPEYAPEYAPAAYEQAQPVFDSSMQQQPYVNQTPRDPYAPNAQPEPVYADGNVPHMGTPLASSHPQAYNGIASQPEAFTETFTGPVGDIPVLGQVPENTAGQPFVHNPYEK
ncbi:MAG: hypothetical protein V3U57_06630 [Robiginitomaculum sp.]